MRQNFVAQFIQLLKNWLCNVLSGIVMKKNWALSVDCLLQGLQFSVHLNDLLSILIRCNGFTGIQKAGVNQICSRPPNSGPDLFLVQICLWEGLWSFFSVQPLSWLLLIVIYSSLFISHHSLIKKWFLVIA